jgi:hypothetical protein
LLKRNWFKIVYKLPLDVTYSSLCLNNGVFISVVLILGHFCSQRDKYFDFIIAIVTGHCFI